jgi:alpha-N-acetylglucosamine transferase
MLILGVLMFLAVVFVRLDKHLPSLPARFRQFAQPYTSSDTKLAHDPCPGAVHWSNFAYVEYVTNSEYLCNSLMILDALRRHRTKTDLLLMYPREWVVPEDNEPTICV